jgi:single-stranded DNA-binding protein
VANRVLLTGRCSQYGAKITWTEHGKPQTTFTLVVEEPGRDGASFKTFVPISVVGAKAEAIAETLEPDDLLVVDGKLAYKSSKTKEKEAGKLVVVTFDVERLMPASVDAGISAN